MLYGCHRDNFRIGADTRTLHVELQPMVFSYLIRYEFLSGIEHVAQARGTLSGIADGVMLHNAHTSSTPVSLLYDADLTPWGVQAVVRSFGCCNFEPTTSAPRGHTLGLVLKLKNGKVKKLDFDVSFQLRYQPRGGVITADSIVITDGEAVCGEFEVDVEDRGDYEDILLPIGNNRRDNVSSIN